MKLNLLVFVLFNMFFYTLNAQIGIGTTAPDSSSIIDVSSSSKGMLTPRMTTAQKIGISNPAEGLLVYDTDIDAFHYFESTSGTWIKLNGAIKRDNHVLVKSVADFPAPSGGKITLNTDVIYEINGVIVLTDPIELNGAYITGLDSNEDVLVAPGGTIFTGSTGGSLRSLTLTAPGGTVFNINDTSGLENLVIQSVIVANSSSVGALQGFNLLFMNVIQFSGNSTGITYCNIKDLLLNNQGWFSNNGGIYETFTGTFSLIEKVSGFSQVVAATAAMDISGIGTITGDAVLESVVFSGGGNYVNGNSPYTGYNFSNDWTVDCPGIPEETDKVATGYIYFNAENSTTTDVLLDNVPVKMQGVTTSGEFFRMNDNSGTDNRINYSGNRTRAFTISCSATLERASNGSKNVYSLIIFKNGTMVPSIVSEQTFENGVSKGNFNLLGSINLATNDYIEVYVSTDNQNIDPTVTRFNMVIQ